MSQCNIDWLKASAKGIPDHCNISNSWNAEEITYTSIVIDGYRLVHVNAQRERERNNDNIVTWFI